LGVGTHKNAFTIEPDRSLQEPVRRWRTDVSDPAKGVIVCEGKEDGVNSRIKFIFIREECQNKSEPHRTRRTCAPCWWRSAKDVMNAEMDFRSHRERECWWFSEGHMKDVSEIEIKWSTTRGCRGIIIAVGGVKPLI
jgi:hypothetical protein